MEISEADIELQDHSSSLISVYIKQENDECEAEFNNLEITPIAQNFCTIEIKESRKYTDNQNREYINNNKNRINLNNETSTEDNSSINTSTSDFQEIQQNSSCNISDDLSNSTYLDILDSQSMNTDIEKHRHDTTDIFIRQVEQTQTTDYISTISIPNEFLEGLHLNIKKEANIEQEKIYATEWLCSINGSANLKESKQKVQILTDIEATITPILKHRGQLLSANNNQNKKEVKLFERSKRRVKRKSVTIQDYKEKLRRKAECMREKRKKLYEEESEEQRLQRLAKEAAKRREIRMYYETPEQRRKRLDAEAARKREYRMYNETPEDRRKRLDREAERRRMKRLSLYASETPEQRRERLNRESAKRREARLNQYAKETEEQRKERLRKDALRAREMRFTRSAIETEEERRQRLVKDALRKREVRMHGGNSVNNNFTELQTVRNFEELNNVQIKDNPDDQLGGHYLSNWMMWFQNTLAQPVHIGEQTVEPQSQNSG